MRPRWVPIGAAAATAVLVTVLVIVVVAQDPPPTGAEALERAQAFVDDAETFEYRGVVAFSTEDDAEFSEELSLEAAVALPDRARVVSTAGFAGETFANETVYVGERVYTREADEEGQLDDEPWLLEDENAGDVGAFGSPLDFAGVLDDVSEPQILARDNGRVLLRVGVDFEDVAPDELVFSHDAAPGAVEPDGPMDLIITEDGRLDALRVSIDDADGFTTGIRVEFTSWNDDVEIDEPDEDEVDETPYVDEEEIESYDDTPLYQPAAVPQGWMLDTAHILAEGETTSGCEEVNTYFIDLESDEFEGYLDVYQFPLTCLNGDLGAGEPFAAGPYTGVITELDEGFQVVRIVVDETVVEVDTDLPHEDLAVVLAAMEPLDFESPPPDTLEL